MEFIFTYRQRCRILRVLCFGLIVLWRGYRRRVLRLLVWWGGLFRRGVFVLIRPWLVFRFFRKKIRVLFLLPCKNRNKILVSKGDRYISGLRRCIRWRFLRYGRKSGRKWIFRVGLRSLRVLRYSLLRGVCGDLRFRI